MSSRRQQLDALFATWFACRERGEVSEADRLLAAHPHLAEAMRARIEALALLDEALEVRTPGRRGPRRRGSIGPYRIVAEVGSGGMGTVYRARVKGEVPGLAEGATVALKVIHPHLLRRTGFLERFRTEATLGMRVVHENVVRTFSCGSARVGGVSEHFLVMEHVEGQTLRQLLDDMGTVPEDLCRHVGREVARGLAAIHAAGAVHRDLKPENVLITKEHVVKLMDLGVARLADAGTAVSQTGAFVGSLLYGAPEQLRAERALDGRTDLFALGILLYELATGLHPFRHDDVTVLLRRITEETARPCADLQPQLSPFYEEIVQVLLAKAPRDRPASAEVVGDILERGEASAWWAERSRAVRREGRPPRRLQAPRDTALYGRDAELATLRRLYERVRGGDGRVVLVLGEAGIGKSRLVDEFMGRLEREGEDVDLLVGTHPPGGAATATGAFAAAFRERLGDPGLEDALRPHLGRMPRIAPAFAAHLRGEPAPEDAEPLARDSLQAAFVQVARSLASRRPTVLLIEDLHFASEDARGLFAALALAVRGHRILLIGTARPDLPESWTTGLETTLPLERVAPGRLGPKDLTRLLVEALGSERLAEDLAFQIAAKSDGNPFFVFEILRGLQEGRFLTRKADGTWITTGALRELEVPASLVEVVKARLSALDADERETLDLAACCGFEFDPLLVAAAAGDRPLVVLQRLARIERAHRLVRSMGALCTFDHHVVQETLAASVSAPLRAAYHTAIAEALEARSGAAERPAGELEGGLCVALAEHFLLGGRGDRAEPYLGAALTHLESQDRLEAVLRLADLAFESPALRARGVRVDLLCRRATSLWRLGRSGEACETAAQAVHLADAADDVQAGGRAADSLSLALSTTARERARLELAEKALEFARLCGARREPPSQGAAGNGDGLPEVGGWQERSVALCREIGTRRGEMYAILSLALESQREGLLETARGQYARGLAIAAELREQRAAASNEVWYGTLLTSLGLADAARPRLAASVEVLRGLGARLSESLAWQSLGELERACGDPQAALSAYAQALGIQRELGDVAAANETRLCRGALLARLGRLDEARADLRAARGTLEGVAPPETAVLAAAHLATLDAAEIPAALSVFERFGRRLPAVSALEARFALWQATGDPGHLADARRRLDALVAQAPRECREGMLARVHLHRAVAAEAVRQDQSAARLL